MKIIRPNNEEKVLDDDLEIANALNETLGNVFVKDDNISELPNTAKLPCGSPLSNIIFYEHKVSEVIQKLIPNKAPGPDGIRARIIIELNAQITPTLTKILNLTMQTGKTQNNGSYQMWLLYSRRVTHMTQKIIEGLAWKICS